MAFLFTACSADEDAVTKNPASTSLDQAVVGTWWADVSGNTAAVWNSGKAMQLTELNGDGTGTATTYYLLGPIPVAKEQFEFNYSTAADGTLTMQSEQRGTTTSKYTIRDGKLQLSSNGTLLDLQKPDEQQATEFDEWSKDEELIDVPQPARFTVLVYGNAGGEMDEIIEQGFWAATQPLLQDTTNVRVMNFYKYGKSTTSMGADDGDVVWFELEKDTKLTEIREAGLQVLGKGEEAKTMKLCDPATLSTFIEFSSLISPAEEYIFVIWGHGSGLNPLTDIPCKVNDANLSPTRGVLADEWNKNEELDMYEFRAAIEQTGLDKRLNTIYFHNCLMGNMETLMEVCDLTKYIVASAHLLSSDGAILTEYVRGLMDKGNSEDAFAQMIQRCYGDWELSYHCFEENMKGEEEEMFRNGDLKLIRADKLNGVIDATQRLAQRLLALYPTQKEAIDRATRQVYRFETPPYENYNFVTPFVDFANYAQLIASETSDAEMAEISQAVDAAFEEAFVKSVDVNWSQEHLDHYTLSVCLANQEDYEEDYRSAPRVSLVCIPLCNFDEGYEQTTFHKLTAWGDWMRLNQQKLWGNPTSNGGGPLQRDSNN